jgi:hypothetical protein
VRAPPPPAMYSRLCFCAASQRLRGTAACAQWRGCRRIKRRALYKMTVGTVLVLLFADPMCDCLGALGERTGCPAFYISFVLAPLASNGTELLAAYNFALKKTQKSVTVSLSQLEGAAIMNNTFCLGIFLFLVYLQDLTWAYSAETIVILLVQLIMVFFARKPVQVRPSTNSSLRSWLSCRRRLLPLPGFKDYGLVDRDRCILCVSICRPCLMDGLFCLCFRPPSSWSSSWRTCWDGIKLWGGGGMLQLYSCTTEWWCGL